VTVAREHRYNKNYRTNHTVSDLTKTHGSEFWEDSEFWNQREDAFIGGVFKAESARDDGYHAPFLRDALGLWHRKARAMEHLRQCIRDARHYTENKDMEVAALQTDCERFASQCSAAAVNCDCAGVQFFGSLVEECWASVAELEAEKDKMQTKLTSMEKAYGSPVKGDYEPKA
jgi:hypothetical protein